MSKTISLVLIDDNRLLREGLAGLIRKQPDFRILAASADIEEALRKVREAKPRVVLLDFALESHDSLRLTATVRQEVPEAIPGHHKHCAGAHGELSSAGATISRLSGRRRVSRSAGCP